MFLNNFAGQPCNLRSARILPGICWGWILTHTPTSGGAGRSSAVGRICTNNSNLVGLRRCESKQNKWFRRFTRCQWNSWLGQNIKNGASWIISFFLLFCRFVSNGEHSDLQSRRCTGSKWPTCHTWASNRVVLRTPVFAESSLPQFAIHDDM